MSERERKLEALGYPIDRTTPEGKLVEALVIDGNTIYASGQVTFDGDQLVGKGKVPSQVGVEEATRMAALCAANVLRIVRKHIGSLEKIDRVLRITGYVNADPDFAVEADAGTLAQMREIAGRCWELFGIRGGE